jgi:nitrogen fixation-related uncharacterized protein
MIKATPSEILNDLINQPGIGMFMWLCFVYFLVASIIFIWALKSGQLTGLEESKHDMFDEEDLELKIPNPRGVQNV